MTLLVSKVTHESYAEDYDVEHPLAHLSFNEILENLEYIKANYPGYDDYTYKLDSKSHGYGARSEWYDLFGLTKES